MYQGLDFVTPLVNDMVSVDPKKRPTMDEVVERFERIRYALPWWKLRARLWSSMEDGHPWMTFTLNVRHIFRTICDILMFRSAVPTYK